MKRYYIETTNGTPYTAELLNDLWYFANDDYTDCFKCANIPTRMMQVSFDEFIAACPKVEDEQ